MPYAVNVFFDIHPEHWEAFLPLMQHNARTSLQQEPGCLQFDVLSDPAYPHHVTLYELYTDRAAFDAHLTSAHFAEFDAKAGQMIASKALRCFADVAK